MKKQFFITCIGILFYQYLDAQNVGIGTQDPTKAKLEVQGGPGNTAAIFGAGNTGVSVQGNIPAFGFNRYHNGTTGTYMSNGYAALQYFDPATGTMTFDMYGNGSAGSPIGLPYRPLQLDKNGHVSVGGLPSASAFSVSRTTHSQSTAFFFGLQHHSTFNYENAENTYIRAGRDNGTVIINDIPGGKIAIGGNVGINTLTPQNSLEIRQINGKGIALVDPNTFHQWQIQVVGSDGHLNLYYDQVHRGRFAINGDYTAISDRRVKTEIQKLPFLLGKVMQLNPVEYEMLHKNPSHKKSIGFIAQEVKAIFPELVEVVKDTASGYQGIDDVHTLNYNGFGVIAIKAIQEQQKVIEDLQTENEVQQETLNVLAKKILNLESILPSKK